MAEQSCQRLYVVLPCDEATLDVPLKHHADIEGGPGGRFLAHLLLIARHGHLALEEYFYGFDQDWVHDMRSAGKTFAPVLAGIAKDQGATLTPQTPIYPLFTQYSSFANPDARKQKIVLRDIMTMTAGNACDDNNDDSPGNEDRMQSDEKQRDWYKYSLDLPMLKDRQGGCRLLLRRPQSCGWSGCRSNSSLASRVLREKAGSTAAVRALLLESDA
jgi:CubicO group peptidase (beta-lactamase class C family)